MIISFAKSYNFYYNFLSFHCKFYCYFLLFLLINGLKMQILFQFIANSVAVSVISSTNFISISYYFYCKFYCNFLSFLQQILLQYIISIAISYNFTQSQRYVHITIYKSLYTNRKCTHIHTYIRIRTLIHTCTYICPYKPISYRTPPRSSVTLA